MSSVIYRKYRPRSFDDVVGQQHIVQTLRNALSYDKVVNSYLFCGPHGTGKTSIARVFSKALNCEDKKDKAGICLECSTCAEIEKGVSPDVIEIDAASNRGIDEIRELREAVKFLPMKSQKKVYIIDEVHMLTKEAFNALLKTLEEPPEHIVFILATTEQNKVPKTIISRTQKFNLHHLGQNEIEDQIEFILKKENVKMDKETVKLISSTAVGSMRDAQSILGKVLSIGVSDYEQVRQVLGVVDSKNIHSFVSNVLNLNRKDALDVLGEVHGGGVDLDNFCSSTIQYLRYILLSTISTDVVKKSFSNISSEEQEQIIELASLSSKKQLFLFIREMLDASQVIKYSQIPILSLELVVMKMTENKDDFVVQGADIEAEAKPEKKVATKKTAIKKPTTKKTTKK